MMVDEDQGTATVNVTLSGVTDQIALVSYSTGDDTAKAGENYTATSGVLTFNPGDTYQTFTVPVTDIDGYNGARTFFVNLSSPVNAMTGLPDGAVVTIRNTDSPPGLGFAVISYDVDEDAGTVTINVVREGITDQTASVVYSTHDGTAVAGYDYETAGGTLTFSQDTAIQSFTIDIVDILLFNQDTFFFVNLSDATDATISRDYAIINIHNTDPSPPVASFTASMFQRRGPADGGVQR